MVVVAVRSKAVFMLMLFLCLLLLKSWVKISRILRLTWKVSLKMLN